MASRWRRSTAARRVSWSRTSTSGSRLSGSAGCASWSTMSRASGKPSATTSTETRGVSSAMTAIEAAPPPTGAGARRLAWRQAEVVERITETRRAATLVLDVPGWTGHLAGQHVDIRLTADDGYQAQRSYSIASPPEVPRLALTVERLERGEVSPWLVDEARPGDRFELRGPIGGYFAWSVTAGGPLLLVAGGSGIAPLMAMLRHRAARGEAGRAVPARLPPSSRSGPDIIYRPG